MFDMTGMLKDWSIMGIIPKLGTISCRTLILNSAGDEAQAHGTVPHWFCNP
jgi:hypothetical protein